MDIVLAILWGGVWADLGQAGEYFGIRVIDAQTGRGVPLVELRTVHEVSYWTDSAGWAAVGDPELMNREVFFHVQSPGYSLPADGFGFRGVRVQVQPGRKTTLKLQRQNIAERLYRITGAGIYRDTVLLGENPPEGAPLVRADVAGQDSVQSVVYRGKVYWFWGDTNRLVYPLGNFRTTGAVSPLPGRDGFRPGVGVPLEYFIGPDGRSKNLCPFEPNEGMIWIDGVVVVSDAKEGEKLIAHYARMKSLEEMVEHGLALWEEEKQEFRPWVRFPKHTANRTLLGHPFHFRQSDGTADHQTRPKSEKNSDSADRRTEYIYCGLAFPNIRVPARWEALADPTQYETWTCLAEEPASSDPQTDAAQSEKNTEAAQPAGKNRLGVRSSGPRVKRDSDGKVLWRWSRHAPPISSALEHRLVKEGRLRLEETYFLPVDVQSSRPVEIHAGSVRWNPWRKRWILIGVQQGGTESFLGEVWYSEAESPVGPWRRAVKIAAHPRYSFYNPVHHDFLDEEGGRIIYFEGTYSHTFSGNPVPTPRYDYNQIMYRLDLADPRLQPVQQ